MKCLMQNNYAREKTEQLKNDTGYWDEEKHRRSAVKKRKIQFEITDAHEKFKDREKENEPSLEEITCTELKDKLKSLGITTKGRKKDKLVQLIWETIEVS